MSSSKSKAKQVDERWSWTEATAPADIGDYQLMKAYNLLSDTCPLGACRANCRQNPCCLNGLGPEKFAETAEAATSLAAMAGPVSNAASKPSTASAPVDIVNDDAADQAADSDRISASLLPNGAIGLTNYGNTCYLNSLLQLYLRSPDLVRAVYRLPSADDAIIGELQSIFARLQLQQEGVCEPVGFIEALNLDKNTQQDASEFRVLFRQLLERRFEDLGDDVMKHYTGCYRNVTRCHACGYESIRESNFHELCLNLTGTPLTDCLRDYLSRQNLDGESRYNCPVCQQPCDASVGIELVSLPDELCLQLMRFDFDMRTLRKKKVKLPIAYPEVLDMSEFLPGAEPYVLKAVLIHLGPQATGGHYVALVRDYSRGWLVCNDSQVFPVKHKLLKRQEEKLEQSMGYSASRVTEKASAGVPPGKDWHTSQNAYILVYEKRSVYDSHKANADSLTAAVPASLAQLVADENTARAKLAGAVARRERRHRDFLGRLASRVLPHLQRVDCHAFVPAAWLQAIFNSSADELGDSNDEVSFFQSSLDACTYYAQYVCPHGCLLPDCVGPHVKAVSRDLFDFLPNNINNNNNNGDAGNDGKEIEDDAVSTDSIVTPVPAPFLAGESALCLTCVRQRCARMRLDARLAADAKLIDKAAKRKPVYQHAQNGQATNGDSSAPRFAWVGVKSLRSWKNLARQQQQESDAAPIAGLVEDEENNEGCGVLDQAEISSSNQKQLADASTAPALSITSSSVSFAFNEDLLCQHGNLCCETGRRRLLPEDVWRRLAAYFPDCPVYWHDAKPCQTCSDQRASLISRAEAETGRLFHLSAHLKRHRPTGSGPQRLLNLEQCGGKIYYADAEFLVQWRRFVASVTTATAAAASVTTAASTAEEDSATTATAAAATTPTAPLAEPPSGPVPNSRHLCQHGRLLHRPDSPDSGLVALTPDEWAVLVEAYSSDGVEICHQLVQTADNTVDDTSASSFQPDVCDQCSGVDNDANELADGNGETDKDKNGLADSHVFKMTIYVRVADNPTANAGAAASSSSTRSSSGRKRVAATSASGASESSTSSTTTTATADATDIVADVKSPPTKCARSSTGTEQQPWRSSRIRRKPTDRRFDIDSNATVQDLKLLLMDAYGVAPYDQHLLVDGRELEPVKSRLMELGLTSSSVVDASFDLPPGSEEAAAAAAAASGLSIRRGGGGLASTMESNDESLSAAGAVGPAEIEVGFSGTRLFESRGGVASATTAPASNGAVDELTPEKELTEELETTVATNGNDMES